MKLPFKVGQLVEVRTFEGGFRGAWFRCKIRKINKKRGKLGHLLEYLDFTEEKLDWTMLYQVAFHYEGNMKGKHRELMVRPDYPPIYNEKQMPHVSEITEVTVIRGDSWRVGDLVDWWTSDSYWSGRITQLLGDDEAQIDLTPPPLGEGSSYKALLKDLRPSLDWSPELGWAVPTQEDGHPCARIVKPVNQVIDRIIQVEDLHNAGQETASGQTSARPLFSSPVSSNSAVSDAAKSKTATEMPACSLGKTVSKKRKHKQESTRLGPADSCTREPSRVVADSGHNGADPAAAVSLSDAAKSRTATEMPACSLGKTVSKKWKNKQKRSPRLGPTDSSTRKPSWIVADSGHNGADPAAAVSDATKSRSATEMPACSLGKTVSKKWKHTQKRSPRLGPADHSTRKPSRVVADSGHNEADPAAEIAQEELNLDNCQGKNSASGRIVPLSIGSDLIEAAILDLEEYVNKVKWLKKLVQCGISSSDAQVPQWEFLEEIP